MSEGYHPKLDDSPLCNEEDSTKYRSMIRCHFWILVLGKIDIDYDISAMNRFKMSSKKGHLKALKRFLRHFKTFQREGLSLILLTLIIQFTLSKIIQFGKTFFRI
jgi:hypothetical protein